MNALVVYAVIAVWTFKVSSVNGNLNITQSGSNKIGSTTYTLACHITGYSSVATWDRGATGIGQCPVGGCLTSTDSRYNFRNDAGAIYVDFLKLEANEDGVAWTCKHGLDPSDVFTVEVDTSSTNESPVDRTQLYVGLGVGLSLLSIFILVVVAYLMKNRTVSGTVSIYMIEFEYIKKKLVKLSWSLLDNVNSHVTYCIETKSEESNYWIILKDSVEAQNCLVDISLLSGSHVYFRVTAKNNGVNSKPLESKEYLLLDALFAPQGPLEIKTSTEEFGTLSWTEPKMPCSSQITYCIGAQWNNSVGWTKLEDTDYPICEVENSVLRKPHVVFRVIAKYDKGISMPLMSNEPLPIGDDTL